ncbi:aspartate:alanine exchanger family transporter [Steroidobacter flavus]|uniref:Aspartate:alanine exchanger family transporter n=1 Tax=Steroidobacter flavus TaxID=1842136 RepID=A0ABV8T545_9GAMM
MAGLFQFLHGEPFFTIFGVVALGMWLGAKKIKGIALGSVVCIILVGLVTSVWAYNAARISLALPEVLQTVFFNLFIFAIGVKIGPQFFSGLERDGWHLVALGLIVAALAPALAFACDWLFDWPEGAVAGVLAGSNNSSASFGAATAAVQSGGREIASDSSVKLVTGALSAAFALCYTVSQVQFVLLMKLLPKFARFDAPAEAQAFEKSMRGEHTAPLPGTVEAGEVADVSVAVRAYRVEASTIGGRTVAEIRAKAPRVSIETVRRENRWLTPEETLKLEPGDEVVVGAPVAAQVRVREALGPEIPDVEARSRNPVHTVDVVVGRRDVAGRTLPELLTSLGPGLYPNALFRAGAELPISAGTKLKMGDVIRVTGAESNLACLGKEVGQVIRASHISDVLTLALGLLVGAALGAIPVPLFGISISFGAAAVLVTGIVFGWLKTRHPALGGPISEGGRSLLEVLGLNTFTAVLAINSGQSVYEVMHGGPVWSLILGCLVISAVPALIAWWIGRHVLHMNPALLMGAIAGARQNTSSMQSAQEQSHSAVPGIGYPVPLAITTVALSVVAYLFALFV